MSSNKSDMEQSLSDDMEQSLSESEHTQSLPMFESNSSTSETDSDKSSSVVVSPPSPLPNPVMVEARAGNAKKLESLLEQGCDYTTKDPQNSRPLLEAARAGHLDCVRVLLEAAWKDFITSEAILENVCPLEKEWEGGEPPWNDQSTPLSVAAGNGHWEIVDLLSVLYSKSNAKETGFALVRACLKKKNKCIQILSKKFPQHVSEIGPRYGLPIHLSARRGDLVAVETLLQAGNEIKYTDINAMVDKYGMTPLHFAAMSGNKDLVLLLLSKGADPCIRVKWYNGLMYTPLTQAAQHGQWDVIDVLVDDTPPECEAVFTAACHSKMDCLACLLDEGFPTFNGNFKAYDGGNPWDVILYQWQNYSNICDIIESLLDHGTNFEALATSDELSILPNHLHIMHDNTLEVFLEYGLIELKWGSQDYPDISSFAKLVGKAGVKFHDKLVYDRPWAYFENDPSFKEWATNDTDIFLKSVNLYQKFFPFTMFSHDNPPAFETLETLEEGILPIFPKLSELCRWNIRCCVVRIYKVITPEIVGLLPLPRALQDFLLYKESRTRTLPYQTGPDFFMHTILC